MAKTTTAVAKIEEPQEWMLMKTTPDKAVRALQKVSGARGFQPFDLTKITVPGSGGTVWTLPSREGERAEKAFTCIILHIHDNMQYWSQAYGTGLAGPPDCQSNDGIRGIGMPGGLCAGCALNRRPKDRDDMTCKASKLMYVLLPDMVLPAVIKVPLMSLRNCDDYLKRQLAAYGDEPTDVYTTLGLEVAPSQGGIKYSKITFERAGDVPDNMRETLQAYAAGFIKELEASYAQAAELAKELGGVDPAVAGDAFGGIPALDLDDDDDLPEPMELGSESHMHDFSGEK